MDMKEILKKCKLTEEELKIFNERVKNISHKEDHARAYRTLMNPIRREILQFIKCEIKPIEEIEKQLDMDKGQLGYHLSMLDQLNYIMNTNVGWKGTPRGIGFLENAQI